jgi:hypothetical protein
MIVDENRNINTRIFFPDKYDAIVMKTSGYKSGIGSAIL